MIVDYHMHLRGESRNGEGPIELLQEIGYETVTVFDGRRPRQEPLG